MSKEDLEPKLAEFMNQIPEVEGAIAFSAKGNVISGQTIEDMDKEKIAAEASKLWKNLKGFSVSIGKGESEVSEITVNLKDGFAVIAFGPKFSIVSFLDSSSKMQLGLVSRALKSLLG